MKVKSCSLSSGRMWVGIESIANCIEDGAWVKVSPELAPMGKHRLRWPVRAWK